MRFAHRRSHNNLLCGLVFGNRFITLRIANRPKCSKKTGLGSNVLQVCKGAAFKKMRGLTCVVVHKSLCLISMHSGQFQGFWPIRGKVDPLIFLWP